AVALVSWALQPLLTGIAARFGWLGALATALLGYFAILGVALWVAPGIVVASPGWAFVASWIFAALMAAVTWAFSLGTDEYLLTHVARQALSDAPAASSDGARGVIMVQLDGVPAPLLQAELRAGNLPTLSRWIRGGTHTWTEWTARVPSTTPVSQAGILHGSNEDIPAFRWWDRDLGRMLVANKPTDAAVIESRISDGRGLLADEGVSISNLFTGDAATVHLTMSAVAGGASALGSSRPYAAFFSHPAGFARALVMTVGEMLKEVAQGRSQERRGIEPRVARHGSYIALRGVTNVMLRDLNTALVVESMVRGAKAVYVDYVDYDEIAHHAGVTRPESLASLYGLDRVLGTLERVAASGIAAREYDIVAVSDHGQSQGATFAQREGRSLEEFIAERTGGRAVVTAHDREGAGAPAALLVRELAAQGARSAQVAARALDREATADAGAGPRSETPIAVVGSGNLGGVWFTAVDHQMTLAEVEEAHPGLVADLVGHPAVGFAVLRTSGGAVAIGAAGTRHLSTGEVAGEDPLAGYPDHTAADFARASAFPHAPDIYLNSTYDPVLDEVAAFEELVGCHGGVGGWQTRPLLVHPAGWRVDPALVGPSGLLYGADAVHRQLVAWLEALGHRGDLR
ncbi:MAG: alkaline phosphatase family protein, partial [Demequina sp.]|uniref:alkaline phosphatase family protein n=1 Tax=Demequina sp. TaxID=2050685 RepID=UPI003A8477F9